MKYKTLVLCLLVASLSLGAQNDSITSKKEKKKLSFRDPDDGAFDVSQFLLEQNGVLPVVIPITEPAVGYGGALALLYFHKKKKKYKTYVPNNLSGLVGLYTENKTWAAGVFHNHTFGENKIRSTTAILKPNVRYKYYGKDSELLAKNPIGVNLDSWYIYQKIQARVGDTKLYLGGSYSYFTSDISLDTLQNAPIINKLIRLLNTNSTISAIKPTATYDSRDNNFSPTKGIKAELSANYSATWLGSDDDYVNMHTDFFGYLPINSKLNSKFRFQGSYLLGDEVPFYAFPFISLRGIAAMRYQNEITLVGETEWSYAVYKRWKLTAFTGGGKAISDFSDFGSADWAYNIGTGIRYGIAKALGVDMGMDFAWGNAKDFAFYVVFGTSW